MPLTLILIRHAKSDWDDPALSDHDRPLNARGMRAAPLIGGWLAAQGHGPDAVLCSSARRTQETWAGIATKLVDPPEAQVLPALYHAEPGTMLDLIAEAQGARLAVVGHNPGMAELAAILAHPAPAHPRFADYPTGASLVLRFEESGWERIGRGRVVDFVTPRDLEPAG